MKKISKRTLISRLSKKLKEMGVIKVEEFFIDHGSTAIWDDCDGLGDLWGILKKEFKKHGVYFYAFSDDPQDFLCVLSKKKLTRSQLKQIDKLNRFHITLKEGDWEWEPGSLVDFRGVGVLSNQEIPISGDKFVDKEWEKPEY